jgi:hypothetical protein
MDGDMSRYRSITALANGSNPMKTDEQVGPDTHWIELLLAEEEALERLVGHAPGIAKFRRVLNDERVAAGLRVADVARMLRLDVGTLLAVARGRDLPDPASPAPTPEDPADDGWANEALVQVAIDLRPVFANGHEPLAMILDEIGRLPADAALVVDAPFHPLPLRRLLGGRGYRSFGRQVAADHWQVAFRAPTPSPTQ